MKKSILLSGIMLISAMALAQEPEKMQQPVQSKTDMRSVGNETVEMKDGKVWLNKDGQISLLSKEINLGGSKISTDGTVVLKDGKKVTLKNGDKVTADGNLVKAAEKQPPYTPDQPEMK
jgi:uncharacterized protein YdeI (BOF family)